MSVEILMPSLDPSMSGAKLAKWLKVEGDHVDIGEAIAEIETDKAIIEVESEAKGILGNILIAEGEFAPVNTVIAVIIDKDYEASNSMDETKNIIVAVEDVYPSSVSVINLQDSSTQRSLPHVEVTPLRDVRILASPLARRLATLEAVDMTKISGSGPKGRVVKCDIDRFLSATGLKNSSKENKLIESQIGTQSEELVYMPSFKVISNSSMRNTIARRLTESSQYVPHYFLTIDCNLDKLLILRKELNTALMEEEKISLNDFVIKAAAIALKKVPAANSMWTDKAILHFDQVDISVAVAIEGGLITPVVRHADAKGVAQISAESKVLARKAREGKLLQEEYRGGTFSISNLGMFGIKSFTSIINPPQGAILSVGAGEQRPVIKDGRVDIGTVMTVTLAADHRCIDGAVGAEFLGIFKHQIEMPLTMLL
jgi:pyruvate dehydrogenase E2 component (dihydrolipoamide acetyltransferase)